MTTKTRRPWFSSLSLLFSVLLFASPLAQIVCLGQNPAEESKSVAEVSSDLSQILQLEKIEIAGGAELITVQAKLAGLGTNEVDQWVPLASILRDTLGDENRENDRLGYVWPPTLKQQNTKQRWL